MRDVVIAVLGMIRCALVNDCRLVSLKSEAWNRLDTS
jgi:hypothetical protein